MTLPSALGHGGTGYHGDDAVRTRTTLSALRTLGNEIKADHNAVLAKLDLDSGVTDTNYAALRTIAAADVAALPATLGQGGSFLHGNDGIATRLILAALRTLANEIKADTNALLAKLDADAGVTDTTYGATTATDEVQVVTITATGGTFTITYAGQTTDAIAYNATAAAVQVELEQLSNIEVGDVVVTGAAGGPYTLTFGGNLADEDVAAVTASGALLTQAAGTGTAVVATNTAGVAAVNEVQSVTVDATSGNFTLTYAGQTTGNIAYNADAATVQTALEALSNIAPGDVVVSGGPGGAGGATPYVLTFGGTLAGTNVAQVTGTDVDLAGGGDAITTGTTTPGVAAVNEVQQITVTANGGTFTVTYSGQTTAAIAYNATAATVQAALIALSNLAPADVVVTGGPGDAAGSAPYILTFGGTLAATNVAEVTTSAAALMAVGTAVPSTSTPGVASKTVVAADIAAIKEDFGAGGANLHGQDAAVLDTAVTGMITLLNEAKAKRNAALAQLDADATVNGTNYVALHATAAADAS